MTTATSGAGREGPRERGARRGTGVAAIQTTWYLVGGKGGVGKTTCAAALALDAARTRRTLLVSTDPASSLGDALRVRVGARPAPVPGAPRLHAADIDAASSFAAWLRPRRRLLARIALRGSYLDEEDVGRLLGLSLPGVDEVIGLIEVERLSPAFDHVVIDTAPTGHTLRLLASPALLERVAGLLDALQAHHRAVVRALRGGYAQDEADAFIAALREQGARLAERLRDPRGTRIVWVTLPEPMALEETADAIAALEHAGVPVGELLINRMTPAPPGPCAWCTARRRFEARAIVPVSRRFGSLRVSAAEEMVEEPRGAAGLRAFARTWKEWTPGSGVDAGVRSRISGRAAVRLAPAGLEALPIDGVRWVFFGGKGGAGKSTCAAAWALHAAASRPARRVLLLSTDPAHSIGDALGAAVTDEPSRVKGGPPNLFVREADATRGLESFRSQYLSSVDGVFGRLTRGIGGESADARAFRDLIDLAPPGLDEVMAVVDAASVLETGAYDTIVADTAPTGHVLRLLQTPAVLRDWVRALMAILLKYQAVTAAGALGALLVQLSQRLRRLQAMLHDAAGARFVLVTRAAALPREETIRLARALGGLRIAVAGVVVNAAGGGECARCRRRQAHEAREIGRLRAALGARAGYAIIVSPAAVPPPHGAAALARWAQTWREYGDTQSGHSHMTVPFECPD